jgi:hypothetical protein
MAKKMTLNEQANHAAERTWPDLNERDGIRRKSVQLWLAGHRANKLARAERAVVKAAVAWATSNKRDWMEGLFEVEQAVKALERAKGGAR